MIYIDWMEALIKIVTRLINMIKIFYLNISLEFFVSLFFINT